MDGTEKITTYRKEYYLANKEKRQAYAKKWRLHSEDRQKAYERRKRYYQKNKEKIRQKNVTRLREKYYGISLEEYESRYKEQDGLCAICGKPEMILRNGRPLSLAVDHCHQTNKVRGLLCSACNKAIGLLNDTPSTILSAFDYLVRNK